MSDEKYLFCTKKKYIITICTSYCILSMKMKYVRIFFQLIFFFVLEPQYRQPPPSAAELRRGGRGAAPAPRLGDGQGPQRADLLHEPYHQDHPVGRPKKGNGFFVSETRITTLEPGGKLQRGYKIIMPT